MKIFRIAVCGVLCTLLEGTVYSVFQALPVIIGKTRFRAVSYNQRSPKRILKCLYCAPLVFLIHGGMFGYVFQSVLGNHRII